MKGLRYLLISIILAVSIAIGSVIAVNSTDKGEFSVDESTIYINWTTNYQGNLTLTNKNVSYTASNFSVTIVNSTSPITNSTFGRAVFSVYGSDGSNYVYSNRTNLTYNSANKTSLIFSTTGLAPGRYSGKLNIYNTENSSEKINTTQVILDVPIDVSSGTGSFSGNISNSTEYYYFNASTAANAVGIRINITNPSNNLINFVLYDSSSAQRDSHIFNQTDSWSSNYTTLYPLSNYWYFRLSNTTNNLTFSGTIELLKASLLVNNSFESGTITLKENLNINRTGNPRQISFWINNTAGYDLTIFEITNSTNLTKYGTSYYMPFIFDMNIGNVLAGLGNLTSVNITVNTTKTNDTEWVYTGEINFATANGYPYKNFTMNLRVNLTHELDVNIANITKASGTGNPVPGDNVIANLAPRYQNGSFISNLNSSSLFNIWMIHGQQANLVSNATKEITNFSVAEGSNYYNLSFQIPSATLGGNYTVYVSAKDNNTKSNTTYINYGTGSKEVIVDEMALKLLLHGGTTADSNTTVISPSSGTTTSVTLARGSYYYIKPLVWNYGSLAAAKVNVSYDTGCDSYLSETGSVGKVQIGDVNAWSNNSNSSAQHWRFINKTASITAETCTLKIYTVAAGTQWDRQNVSISFTITAAPNNTADGSGSSTGVGTTPPPAANDTTTKTYDLEITSFDKEIKIEQNKTKESVVKVKNKGETIDVTTSISGLKKEWYTAAEKQNIAKSEEKSFTFKLKIPEDADVKRYDIEFEAGSSNSNVKAKTVLYVLPGNKTKNQMLVNVSDLTSRYKDLLKFYEEAKKAGKNVSDITARIIDAESLINKTNKYIDDKDWFSAYELLDDITSALNDVEGKIGSAGLKTLLPTIKIEAEQIPLIAGAILTIIGGVGLLIYFYPNIKNLLQKKGASKKVSFGKISLKDLWNKSKKIAATKKYSGLKSKIGLGGLGRKASKKAKEKKIFDKVKDRVKESIGKGQGKAKTRYFYRGKE